MSAEQPAANPALEASSKEEASALPEYQAIETGAAQELPAANTPAAIAPTPPAKQSPPAPTVEDELPPAKPPRPLSPQQQAQATLQEAFPSIDAAVVRAVLVASGGKIEPAFNALLSMSDPSFAEEQPPPQPPRPTAPGRQSPSGGLNYNPAAVYPEQQRPLQSPYLTSTPQNQLAADEFYARQLAEHFNGPVGPAGPAGRGGRGGISQRGRRQPSGTQHPGTQHRRGDSWDDDDLSSDKEHSFLDDDLPVIKENIKKGFLETQKKVNTWLSDFKKKLDVDTEEPVASGSGSGSGSRGNGQYSRVGSRGASSLYEGPSRRSPHTGYDADPRVLGDDFAHLELRDPATSTTSEPTPSTRRPIANPNLFQPAPSKSPNTRKVSFDERPITINDEELYRPGPTPGKVSPVRVASPGNGSRNKWEPLKSVEPAPMDRDPFSLGDSDDEREVLAKEGGETEVSGAQETGVKKA
ncbi:ubiquitin-binding protein cue5 [Rhizina undulata]